MSKNQKKLNDALIQIDPELIEEAALSTEVTGGHARSGIFLRVCVPAALYAVLLICATVGVLHFASPFKSPAPNPPAETTQNPSDIGQAIVDIFKDVIWLDAPQIELPDIEDAIWHDVTVPPLVTLPEIDPPDTLPVDPPTLETENEGEGSETEGSETAPSITLPEGIIPPEGITLPDTLPPIELPENPGSLNGFDINSYLQDWLEKQKQQSTDDPMAVQVSGDMMEDFTYQGKTLSQWQEEIAKTQAMYEQMQQVMNALQNQQSGTQSDLSGMEELGMSMLNSLLNGGNFNRETVNNLSSALHQNLTQLTESLTEFYKSYQKEHGDELSNLLKQMGANVYSALTGGDSLIFATPSQLEQITNALTQAGIDPSTLRFDLASKDVLNQLAPDLSTPDTSVPSIPPIDPPSTDTLDPLDSWIADHFPSTPTPSYNWNNLAVEQDLLRNLLSDTLNQSGETPYRIHLEQTEHSTLSSFLHNGMKLSDHEQIITEKKAALDEIVKQFEEGHVNEDAIAAAQDELDLAGQAYDAHIEAYEKVGYTGHLSRLLSDLGYTVTDITEDGVILSASTDQIASLAQQLTALGENSSLYLLSTPET